MQYKFECLASFLSRYEYWSITKRKKNRNRKQWQWLFCRKYATSHILHIRNRNYNKDNGPENYAWENLLLYFPRRNEIIDLKGNYDTYIEHYDTCKDTTKANRNQYCHYKATIDQAEDCQETMWLDSQYTSSKYWICKWDWRRRNSNECTQILISWS